MARFADVTFDAVHPASLARFWALALEGYDVAPYDDEELARLAALGIHDVEDDPSVLVEAGPDRPRLFFQLAAAPKAGKNRVHLDLRATDVEAEVARLTAAGATVLWRTGDRVTLADPEGNELCIDPA